MNIFASMTPEQFCANAYAEDSRGWDVDPSADEAVAWCAQGWAARELGVDYIRDEPEVYPAMLRVAQGLGYTQVGDANDDLGWPFIEALQAAGI